MTVASLLGERTLRFAGAIVLAVLAVTVAFPVVSMLRRFLGIGTDGGLETIFTASTIEILGFTIWQAALSTVLTLLLGFPLAAVLARYRFPGRSLIEAVTLVPFVLPTVVVAVAVQRMMTGLGFEIDGIDGSLTAILVAHVIFNLSVVVRVVAGHWRSLGRHPEESAAVLGAPPLRVFLRVTLPMLRPAIISATAVVSLFTFTSFGVILILGGLSRATLETEIYRFAIVRNDFGGAAALALVQALAVAGLAVANQRLQRHVPPARSGGPARRPSGLIEPIIVVAVVAVTLVILLAPLASLTWRSVRVDGGLTLDHYRDLFTRPAVLPVSPIRALMNSLVFAAVAGLLAAVAGGLAAIAAQARTRMGRLVEIAALVPLGISAVTLGFGYLIGFTFWELRRSPVLVVVAHAVIGVPFVVATLAPAIRSLSAGLIEASATLGAGPARTLTRVVVPLLRPALAAGAGFAAVISIGEFGASGFLARGRASFTAPQAVFGLLGQPGVSLQGQAAALCVVLGLVVVAVVVAIDRGRGTVGRGWL